MPVRKPSAITIILLGLVLIPTCVLAYMGFFAADALDNADADRLRRELDAAESWASDEGSRVAQALTANVQARVEAAAERLAGRLPHVAPSEMRAEIDAAVASIGPGSVRCRNGRLVHEDGTLLYPATIEPEPGVGSNDPVDLEALFRELRLAADRAYYGEGGQAAAVAVWQEARGRFAGPRARATADVELARLRARPGGRDEILAAYTSVHEAWPADVRVAVGRPWILLALAAAPHAAAPRQELRRLLDEGHADATPLTADERQRVIRYGGLWKKTSTGSSVELHPRAWAYHDGLVAFRAPLRAGVAFVVDMPVREWRSGLFSRMVRQRRFEQVRVAVLNDDEAARWAPGGSRHGERVRHGLPGAAIIDIAGPTGFRTTIALTHRQVDDVADERRTRRRFILLAVAALVLVTLTGLLLVRRGIARERAARRLRDEFIANVTHEVRTPLTSVLLHSQLLVAEDATEAKRREHADVVQAQGRRLAALIDDMLDFARLERGTRSLEAAPVDLGTACREAIAPYLVLAEKDGLDVACEIAGEEAAAMADPAALARILGNLVGNAWKHGRPSRAGGSGRIRITAREDATGGVVEVRDDGPGIPAEERRRVFERFGRGRRSTRVEGSGIGLSLSRDLARAMGGDLTVDDDGEETVFQLWLPPLPDLSEEMEA